jgi:hypothetical protein
MTEGFKCTKCGTTDVQLVTYCQQDSAGNLSVSEDDYYFDDYEDSYVTSRGGTWCRVCEDHTPLAYGELPKPVDVRAEEAAFSWGLAQWRIKLFARHDLFRRMMPPGQTVNELRMRHLNHIADLKLVLSQP